VGEGAIIRFNENMDRERIEMQRVINAETWTRPSTPGCGRSSPWIHAAGVGNLKDALTDRARKIVAEAATRDDGEFVRDVACEFAPQAIAELLGVPQEDRLKIFDWSNRMVSYDDPDFDPDDGQTASFEIAELLHGDGRGAQGVPSRRHRHEAGHRGHRGQN